MSNKILLLISAVLILMASGCGDDTVTPDNDQQVQTGPVDPYGDPPEYGEDPFEGFPQVIGMSVPSGEEQQYQEEILTGTHFTVQITAATDEEVASRLAESVEEDTIHPVFVDREGDYWKVRVGAFPARSDAETYVQEMVDMGFSDAWVTSREP